MKNKIINKHKIMVTWLGRARQRGPYPPPKWFVVHTHNPKPFPVFRREEGNVKTDVHHHGLGVVFFDFLCWSFFLLDPKPRLCWWSWSALLIADVGHSLRTCSSPSACNRLLLASGKRRR